MADTTEKAADAGKAIPATEAETVTVEAVAVDATVNGDKAEQAAGLEKRIAEAINTVAFAERMGMPEVVKAAKAELDKAKADAIAMDLGRVGRRTNEMLTAEIRRAAQSAIVANIIGHVEQAAKAKSISLPMIASENGELTCSSVVVMRVMPNNKLAPVRGKVRVNPTKTRKSRPASASAKQ